MPLIIVAILVLIWGYYTLDSRFVLAGIALAIAGVAVHHFRHYLHGTWAAPLTHGGMSIEAERAAMARTLPGYQQEGYRAAAGLTAAELAARDIESARANAAQMAQMEQQDREYRRRAENERAANAAAEVNPSACREMMAKMGLPADDCPQ
jgi:hypothetical protein